MTARALVIARFEAGELWRDPQVGMLLAAVSAITYAMAGAEGGSARELARALVTVTPLAFVFLAGARRGAAHEAAFRRLVATCPLTPTQWVLGRFGGLMLLALAPLALLAPAVGLALANARAPLWGALLLVAAYLGAAAVATLAGLALRGPRAPLLATILVAGLLVAARAGGLVAMVGDVARPLVALLPPMQAQLLADAGALAAPAAPAALALGASVGACAAWALWAHGARVAWGFAPLAGVLWLAFAITTARVERATDVVRDVVPAVDGLWLLAVLPLAPALARRWRVRTA